jgi:hypothetical protein
MREMATQAFLFEVRLAMLTRHSKINYFKVHFPRILTIPSNSFLTPSCQSPSQPNCAILLSGSLGLVVFTFLHYFLFNHYCCFSLPATITPCLYVLLPLYLLKPPSSRHPFLYLCQYQNQVKILKKFK